RPTLRRERDFPDANALNSLRSGADSRLTFAVGNFNPSSPSPNTATTARELVLGCLIPRFDGAILSREWKEALWDKFVTGAPRPRTPSEQQYSDRKLRSRS
ncbi:MAG: hypothetical protein ACRCUE_15885, partial [Bosea sp. (in: a-proteobacteria)]